MFLFIVGLLALGGGIYMLAEVVTLPVREREGSIQRATAYGRTKRRRDSEESLRERAILPAKEKLARLVLRVNRKWTIEQVSFRLLSAGLPGEGTPTGVLAPQGGLAHGGLLGGLVLGGDGGGGGAAAVLGRARRAARL